MTITHRKKRLIAILLSVALLLSGCSYLWSEPLSAEKLEKAEKVREFLKPKPLPAEKVEEFLTRHREDIDIVVDYLKELEYDHAFFNKQWKRGKIFYELEWHDISSKEVKTSIRKLWRAGCVIISKDESDNTIYFELWDTVVESASCGLACTIDGEGTPKTRECQISCEEIEAGWFYYYCNYEFYRSHIRRTTY